MCRTIAHLKNIGKESFLLWQLVANLLFCSESIMHLHDQSQKITHFRSNVLCFDFIDTDNVWDVYAPLKSHIHENCSTRVAYIHGRVDIPKPLASAQNVMKRLQWCRDLLNWTQLQWQQIIWSDELLFTLFQTNEHVFIWQTPSEAFHASTWVVST